MFQTRRVLLSEKVRSGFVRSRKKCKSCRLSRYKERKSKQNDEKFKIIIFAYNYICSYFCLKKILYTVRVCVV